MLLHTMIICAFLQFLLLFRNAPNLAIGLVVVQSLCLALIFIPYLGYIFAIIYLMLTTLITLLFQSINVFVMQSFSSMNSNNKEKGFNFKIKTPKLKRKEKKKKTEFKDVEFSEK